MVFEDKKWSKGLKEISEFQNCHICNARLVLNLCHYRVQEYYCEEHCPEHKWQSDYDWPTECARCGLSYTHYLMKLLDDNKIPYSKP